MAEEGCVPLRIVLLALSAGSVLLVKESGVIKLPEVWLGKDETICGAASRLASSLVGDNAVKIVAAVWLSERRYPRYHLVFAVEGFVEKDVAASARNTLMLRLEDAFKLVDEPVHKELLAYVIEFKPRPLIVCSL